MRSKGKGQADLQGKARNKGTGEEKGERLIFVLCSVHSLAFKKVHKIDVCFLNCLSPDAISLDILYYHVASQGYTYLLTSLAVASHQH